MFSNNHTARKIGILAITLTLFLGAVSALSWEQPTNNDEIPGGYTLNVTGDDSNQGGDVNLSYDDGSGWAEITTSPTKTGSGSDAFWTHTGGISGDLGSVEDLDLKANYTSSAGHADTITVTLDKGDPNDPSLMDTLFGTEDPTVEVEASDDYSGIQNISFTVDEDDGDIWESEKCTGLSSDTETCSLDLDDVNDGDYSVNATTFDQVGHSTSKDDLSFTVDTSYDGDTSPSLPDSDDPILLEDDEEYEFDVELSEEDEDTDITVTCYDGDDEKIDSVTNSVDGDTTFTCDVDGDDYSDTETDIYVEVCDQAGNCEESDTETYTFDGTAPTIYELSIPGDIVNDDFPVEYETSPDVSGIDEMEYFYSSDVDEGDGNTIDDPVEGEGEFDASVEDIDEGDNTIYVRAKDGADRWSPTKSLEFEYDPDAEPEISYEAPSELSVTAGESTSFDVELENTGDVFIDETNVTVENEVVSKHELIEDLEPGDTKTVTFDIDTEEADIGEHDVSISISYPETSESFKLLVEANDDQVSELDSKLSKYEKKLENLEANITELENSGLSDERSQRLESNVSTFRQKIEDAKSAKENGEYYNVDSDLEKIDQEFQKASGSLETVEKEHRKAQRMKWLMVGIGFIVVLAAGTGGLLYTSDEYDFNLDRLVDSDISIGSFEDIPERINSIFSSEDEAEQFEWDGFED